MKQITVVIILLVFTL